VCISWVARCPYLIGSVYVYLSLCRLEDWGINCAWPLPCAPLHGGLLHGLGRTINGGVNVNLGGAGVTVGLQGGKSVEVTTPVGTIAVTITDPVDAEAPTEAPPSPEGGFRKLLRVSLLTHSQ
jgi:hypothetical protein